jgi:hypothetical protein
MPLVIESLIMLPVLLIPATQQLCRAIRPYHHGAVNTCALVNLLLQFHGAIDSLGGIKSVVAGQHAGYVLGQAAICWCTNLTRFI